MNIIKPDTGIIGAKSSKNNYQSKEEFAEKTYKELLDLAKSSDYNVTLTDPDPEKLNKALKEFVEKPINSLYESIELLDESQVIVELFKYEEVSDSAIMGPDGNPIVRTMILPYVKVLKSSETSTLVAGDILYAPDAIMSIETNIEWIAWMKSQQVERPKPEDPEPPQYQGMILTWRRNSMFLVDKQNPTEDDIWTFILPQHFFKVRINKKELLK